jgi:hypothetical protein
MYPISLAEQDFFTNLGFTHPDLFQVLPCHFNAQFSIQVGVFHTFFYLICTVRYFRLILKNMSIYFQYLTIPYEGIFNSYHYCDKKTNLKVGEIIPTLPIGSIRVFF